MGEAGQDSRRIEQAGWSLLRAGNPRAAVREFKSALSIEPESIGALTGLAQGHLTLGEHDEARKVAKDLLRIAPEQSVSHRLMAATERQRLNRKTALTHAQEALRLDPFDPLNHHVLANVFFDMGKMRQALEVVRKGREAAPHFAVLLAQEARIVMELKGGKAAEPLALEAMRMAPDDEYVLGVAARVKLVRGDLEEARLLAARILQQNANDEEAVSIYLLSDARKYGVLRAHTRFPYWRREHGVLGGAAGVAMWAVLILAVVVLVLASHVPGLAVGLAYRWFWMAQYNGHRNAVKAHFAQPQLKAGF